MNTLIIDDSNIISHMISSALKPYGYEISHKKLKDFENSRENLSQFDLFIINTSISSIEGIELIRRVRRRSKRSYIIGIITKGDWREKISFLEAGADDVLNYPFPMQEIVARIQNVTSRPQRRVEPKYKIGETVIDLNSRNVILNDKPLYLRKKEFGILEYLARNNQRPVSRSELLDNVWDYRKITGSNTVDVHISSIRKKTGDRKIIKTVHGFGYRINDECEEEDSSKETPEKDPT
jgi:DNA-binding response OmpR family regulator